MKCPKCEADTKVVDSRPEADGTQIRRRRVCDECSHRFTTFESTYDAASKRARWRQQRKAQRDKMTPERAAAVRAHRTLMEKSRLAARETGLSVGSIRERWGIGSTQ